MHLSGESVAGGRWSAARKRAMRTYRDTFQVVVAKLGDNATITGAAAWAEQMAGKRA